MFDDEGREKFLVPASIDSDLIRAAFGLVPDVPRSLINRARVLIDASLPHPPSDCECAIIAAVRTFANRQQILHIMSRRINIKLPPQHTQTSAPPKALLITAQTTIRPTERTRLKLSTVIASS